MNYYQHHIGDYAMATAHLTWDEDLAYVRLLRAYYHHEKPIPADMKEAARLIRATSKKQKDAMETVLKEFFVLQTDGWHQKRCDEEIEAYQEKSEKAKKSAQARWGNTNNEGNADGMRTHSEPNAPKNQEPLTNNQSKNLGQNGFDLFWSVYPKKVKKKTTKDIWKRKKLDGKSEIIVADIAKRAKSDGRWLDGFIPDPTTYLNQERWEDELQPIQDKKGNGGVPPPSQPQALEKYASSHGIHAKPGESHQDLYQRCLGANR